jgi:hypothetical protein
MASAKTKELMRHNTVQEPEPIKHVSPPAELANRFAADAGKGLSTDQADNMVPLIYVLQSNSPQAKKGDPNRIDGAEAGDFWLRNATVIKGEEGLLFQNCYFDKDFVEWQPDRGGFVGRHRDMPADAVKEVDPSNENKITWVRSNGNEVVETRYHVGRILNCDPPLAYILPFASTGHSVSRSWMFMMNSKQFEGSKVPAFARSYRLKTKVKTKGPHSWFMVTVEDGDWVSTEDYAAGEALYNAFNTGAKVAEAPAAAEPEAVERDKIPF